ncbi:MAG: hypothetical protein Q8Q08_04555 [Candidatus Omnitrophota bacterium]|nr:hypothetical protein [Candidatus Omnitrophota bacterium]MDZ4241370.1 hypothetical protein [Candidatus Omnitrophota bacterium]
MMLLRCVNVFLCCLCLICAVLIGWQALDISPGDSAGELSSGEAMSRKPEMRAIPVSKAGNFMEYGKIFESRDLFTGSAREQDTPDNSAGHPIAASRPNLSGGYQVVGIVLDDHPVAVLEGGKAEGPVFLSPGDRLEGAVLERILDGRVIFEFQGERMELAPVR